MIWSAILLGLLGSLHCVGMCGPIAFMLPLDRNNKSKRVFQILSYHTGRLFTYALIGTVIGFISQRLHLFGIQQQLSILIGVLMIVVVVIPVKVFNTNALSRPIYTMVFRIKNALGTALKKKDPGTFFTIGFLNGMLPCGLVYMAVFAALAGGGVSYGALYMVLFGIGTIPLMTTAAYLGNFLKQHIRQKIRTLLPLFIVAVGVLFILRGMGLGIPYISPTEMAAVEMVDASHSCH